MFPQAASSSHTLWDLSAEISPDQSSCSSDTGDVLIRSTRVHLNDRRHEAGPGPGSVLITVQKLRDPPPVQSLSSRTEKQQQQRPKPRQKPDIGAPVRAGAAAADHQPGKRSSRCYRNTGDLSSVMTRHEAV